MTNQMKTWCKVRYLLSYQPKCAQKNGLETVHIHMYCLDNTYFTLKDRKSFAPTHETIIHGKRTFYTAANSFL